MSESLTDQEQNLGLGSDWTKSPNVTRSGRQINKFILKKIKIKEKRTELVCQKCLGGRVSPSDPMDLNLVYISFSFFIHLISIKLAI